MKQFQSDDSRFGLQLQDAELQRIQAACQRAAPDEVGGLLVGHYSDHLDVAIVTSVSDLPVDSRAGPTWFWRGVSGLQRWLDRLWRDGAGYYLGEWHFHPYASATPSETDIRQMVAVALAEDYHCPEPILLIAGGDPWRGHQMRVFVVLPTGRTLELR